MRTAPAAAALAVWGALGTGAARAQTGAPPVPGPAGTGPAVIAGRVLDRSERPLPGAVVTFMDTEIETRAGADGRFALGVDFVPDGVVEFRHVGFAPARVAVRLARGDTLRLVARLARVDVLDTVRTLGAAAPSARLAGFEARRAAGRAVFVTREEIERHNSIAALDLLRWSGAVRIVDSLGVLLPSSTRGGRWNARRNSYDPNCIMRVAVDGVVMAQGFSLRELPSPKEIHGIEIHKGPSTLPGELGGARADAYCGMILVWTRAGGT
jgi:hypothetical protein